MSDTDLELLARYVEGDSQEAFAELVRRHLDLVYCAALRQVRSPQLAEEIAQSAFLDLARHAARLAPGTVVSAWLYEVTRRTAVDVIRRESRRQQREQIATEMNALENAPADWRHIAPLLDEAMHALDSGDRAAVLLRYFEGRSFREVGEALGTSDDTAQKRVSRALDRLREHFSRHGVTIGPGALATVLSANAVQSAPAGLAVLITTTAGSAILGGSVAATTKALAMTMTQKTLIAAGLAAAVALGVFQARHNAALNSENAALRRNAAVAQAELERLQRAQDAAARSTAQATAQTQRDNKDAAELLRLRGEVARLKRDAQDAADQLKQANTDLIDAWSKVPPVKTLVATANETLKWDEALVTGGWTTPAGKRALMLVTTEPTAQDKQLMILSRILEYPEDASEALGIARFGSRYSDSSGAEWTVRISLAEAQRLMATAKGLAGVDVLSAPRMVTSSGVQSKISSVEMGSLPNGETYKVGPTVDFVPTISDDGQSVQLRMTAQINLAIPRPGAADPAKK